MTTNAKAANLKILNTQGVRGDNVGNANTGLQSCASHPAVCLVNFPIASHVLSCPRVQKQP